MATADRPNIPIGDASPNYVDRRSKELLKRYRGTRERRQKKAEQLAEAVEISELEGLTRYEWVQNSYSLLDCGDDETLSVCREHGLGYEAFGPLAGGWLTGRYRRNADYPEGSRMTQRPDGYRKYENDACFDALEAFEARATDHGVSMAGLAIAWLLGVPEMTAVVVGPTRAEQLEPIREALGVRLDAEDHADLRGLFA